MFHFMFYFSCDRSLSTCAYGLVLCHWTTATESVDSEPHELGGELSRLLDWLTLRSRDGWPSSSDKKRQELRLIYRESAGARSRLTREFII